MTSKSDKDKKTKDSRDMFDKTLDLVLLIEVVFACVIWTAVIVTILILS